jgi:hypothetical protein
MTRVLGIVYHTIATHLIHKAGFANPTLSMYGLIFASFGMMLIAGRRLNVSYTLRG